MIGRIRFSSALLAATLIFSTAAPAGAAGHSANARMGQIRAMTQNLYVGADLHRIVEVADPNQIPFVVADVFHAVETTNFPQRAVEIAREVKEKQPDVIGLEEVSLIRVQSPSDYFIGNPEKAQTVVYDYLQILLDALAKKGLHYRVASQVTESDMELPAFAGLDPQTGAPKFNDIRLTDRDVILARSNVFTANPMGANYQTTLEIPVAGGITIPFTRGYTAVDATVRGKTWRVVDTHLEERDSDSLAGIQAGQAQELISVLATETKPVLLLGDMNSSPTDPDVPTLGVVTPYRQFVGAGFTDSWVHSVHDDGPGYTCCELETLDNPTPTLDQRIDYVFYRPEMLGPAMQKTRLYADLVGNDVDDKSASELWPSDHAGLYARVRIPVATPSLASH